MFVLLLAASSSSSLLSSSSTYSSSSKPPFSSSAKSTFKTPFVGFSVAPPQKLWFPSTTDLSFNNKGNTRQSFEVFSSKTEDFVRVPLDQRWMFEDYEVDGPIRFLDEWHPILPFTSAGKIWRPTPPVWTWADCSSTSCEGWILFMISSIPVAAENKIADERFNAKTDVPAAALTPAIREAERVIMLIELSKSAFQLLRCSPMFACISTLSATASKSA